MITVGTKSSNGFADLAQYDEDGNGWIDENDAICLQNVSTDYTRKSQTGQTPGAVRYSGAFLYENGDCGTIQHVDVAKYAKEA